MTWYSGIDLHSTNSVVVVIDEADRVAYQRRLPNELPEILVLRQQDALLAQGELNDFFVRSASGCLHDGKHVIARGAQRPYHREVAALVR